MIQRAMIEADVIFRKESDGGRAIPPGVLGGLQYRPHIVIGDPNQREAIFGADRVIAEEYLGIAFVSGPERIPLGQPIRVVMMLIYWPNLDYRRAVPDATFTLREGGRIVGQGRITKRWTESWESTAGQQDHTMTADQALSILRSGDVLTGERVSPIVLAPAADVREIRHPIKIQSCQVEEFDAALCEFHEPVTLSKSMFERAGFVACYFLQGLSVEGCHFRGRVNFECGGHNAADKTVLFQDTVFEGFVNFFDCLFEGPVILRNVEFREGTNLCGFKGTPTEPTFSGGLTLDRVSGKLDFNEELT
jgi:hypothetical protein